MIKRAFIVFFAPFAAGIIAAAMMLPKLNPDPYRAQVETYLENYLHQEVELGSLSVHWDGIHPTFTAEGFAIKSTSARQILFRAKKAKAAIRLSGIFFHQLIIDQMILEEAHFSLFRQENGEWNWRFPGNKKTQFGTLLLGSWKIRIDAFEAPGASVYYSDQSQLPYFHHVWRGLHIRLAQLNSESCKVEIVPEASGVLKKLELRLTSPQQLLLKADLGSEGQGEGEVRDPLQKGHFSLKIRLQDVDWRLPGLTGRGGSRVEAYGEGVHPESLKRTLILKGQVGLQNGRILKWNLPGEILKTISPLPGFSNVTRQAFKKPFQLFSANSETEFQTLDADYRLSNGKFFAENIVIEAPYYRIQADGNWNLMDDNLDIRGDCFLKGEFATHVISRVKDMEVLSNAQQELEIPFSYKGSVENFKPSADLFYIANRLIQVRGGELASRGIQKINEFLEGIRK